MTGTAEGVSLSNSFEVQAAQVFPGGTAAIAGSGDDQLTTCRPRSGHPLMCAGILTANIYHMSIGTLQYVLAQYSDEIQEFVTNV